MEVYNLTNAFLYCIEQLPYKRPMIEKLPHGLDWDRLSLKPVTTRKLKTILTYGPVRFACATSTGLVFMMGTRHPQIAGRRAKRVKTGFWECYQAGKGWVKISNECECWLHP